MCFSQYKFTRTFKPAETDQRYTVISLEVHVPWETTKEVVPPSTNFDAVFTEIDYCQRGKTRIQVAHRYTSNGGPDCPFDRILQAIKPITDVYCPALVVESLNFTEDPVSLLLKVSVSLYF